MRTRVFFQSSCPRRSRLHAQVRHLERSGASRSQPLRKCGGRRVLSRLIRSSAQDGTFSAPSDNSGFAAQLRIISLFNGCVKRIHINVDNFPHVAETILFLAGHSMRMQPDIIADYPTAGTAETFASERGMRVFQGAGSRSTETAPKLREADQRPAVIDLLGRPTTFPIGPRSAAAWIASWTRSASEER